MYAVVDVYDDAWDLDASAEPVASSVRFQMFEEDDPVQYRLGVIPQLDLLYVGRALLGDASELEDGASPTQTGWRDAAYDPAHDRLFVASTSANRIDVVEQASTKSAPFDPSWTLFEEGSSWPIAARLAVDGQRLYAGGDAEGESSWHGARVAVWPLDAASAPTAPAYDLRGHDSSKILFGGNEPLYTLVALPVGVMIGTERSLVAWSDESAVSAAGPESSALETDVASRSMVVSRAGRVYTSFRTDGGDLTVYPSAALGTPVGSNSLGGSFDMVLIER